MNLEEAQKIINDYGDAIASDPNVAKKISSLPCSKARIKQAFFVVIEELVKMNGSLSKEIGENFVQTYCMLDSFLENEKAIKMNDIGEKIRKKELGKDNKETKQYFDFALNAIQNPVYFDEINNFIKECYDRMPA